MLLQDRKHTVIMWVWPPAQCRRTAAHRQVLVGVTGTSDNIAFADVGAAAAVDATFGLAAFVELLNGVPQRLLHLRKVDVHLPESSTQQAVQEALMRVLHSSRGYIESTHAQFV